MARLVKASTSAAAAGRPSMMCTSAVAHSTAVRMKPLPRMSSVRYVAPASPVSAAPEVFSAASTPPSSMRTTAAATGTKASATAAPWRGGEAWKAWAVISRPMKTRIGAMAASGSSPTSTPSTPSEAPRPITSPVASV